MFVVCITYTILIISSRPIYLNLNNNNTIMQISNSDSKIRTRFPYLEQTNQIKQPSTVSKEGLASKLLNEKEIELTEDILKKIDMLIEEQWHLFVIFYQLQDTFPIAPKIDQDYQFKVGKASSKDFENLMNSFLDSYGIKKNKNNELISYSKEGDYMLQNAKIWIMHIMILKENYYHSLIDLFPLFEMAIERNAEISMLFDFFISMLIISDDLEDIIDKMTNQEENIPIQFMELWKKHKVYICNEIQKTLSKKMNEINEKDEENI